MGTGNTNLWMSREERKDSRDRRLIEAGRVDEHAELTADLTKGDSLVRAARRALTRCQKAGGNTVAK